VLVMPDL
jgi:ribonuclease HI